MPLHHSSNGGGIKIFVTLETKTYLVCGWRRGTCPRSESQAASVCPPGLRASCWAAQTPASVNTHIIVYTPVL